MPLLSNKIFTLASPDVSLGIRLRQATEPSRRCPRQISKKKVELNFGGGNNVLDFGSYAPRSEAEDSHKGRHIALT